MGDIARCSLGKPDEYYNEDLLYDLFGVSAELLIDHAWGWEPCTLADIRAYKPGTAAFRPDRYCWSRTIMIMEGSSSGKWRRSCRWSCSRGALSPISWCWMWDMILITLKNRIFALIFGER